MTKPAAGEITVGPYSREAVVGGGEKWGGDGGRGGLNSNFIQPDCPESLKETGLVIFDTENYRQVRLALIIS